MTPSSTKLNDNKQTEKKRKISKLVIGNSNITENLVSAFLIILDYNFIQYWLRKCNYIINIPFIFYM